MKPASERYVAFWALIILSTTLETPVGKWAAFSLAIGGLVIFSAFSLFKKWESK